MKIVLTYSTETGLQEIPLNGESLSFGRGSDADYRFDDDGLSRLHSTVYREDEQIWIADENSTNGTFVNGQQVGAGGTPLNNGDTIRIGNYTTLKVKFIEESAPASVVKKETKVSNSSATSSGLFKLIPILAIVFAFFVIGLSAVVVGVKVFTKKTPPPVNRDIDDPTFDEDTPTPEKDAPPTPIISAKPSNSPIGNVAGNENTKPLSDPTNVPPPPPSGKKYAAMSEDEKFKYVEAEIKKVAAIIGNRDSGEIPRAAVVPIKKFVDQYFERIRPTRFDGCQMSNWLKSDTATIYERAAKNVPFINRAFTKERIDVRVGIYVAMIESEHCPCLSSKTGPLGMFQFTTDTAKRFFDNPNGIIRGANWMNPDDRCKPEIAAHGSAKYLKFLMNWFGTGPASFPLAIAGYNSGEGDMMKNLKIALDSDSSLGRDFWSLIANSEKLTHQFKTENFHYPPKFFAAAVIGENPADFGLNIQPLSTYTSSK